LEEVIGHYKAGGRTTKKGEFAGVGSENQLKSNFVSGFKLTVQRTARLPEFPDKFNKGLIYQQPRFEIPEFTLFLTRQ
jgi:cytochrome c peroxidase